MITTSLVGQLAGILALAACPAYVLAIVKGSTRPNRATWWIITLVGCLVASSYWASGGRQTIWIALTYVASPLVIAVLSVKYGDGRWTILDQTCFLGASVSAALWWLSSSALTALCINIAIDFLGLLPTISKSYSKPWTESRAAWSLTSLASLLNIFAVERWNFAIAAYPIYLAATNCLIAGLILRRAKSR